MEQVEEVSTSAVVLRRLEELWIAAESRADEAEARARKLSSRVVTLKKRVAKMEALVEHEKGRADYHTRRAQYFQKRELACAERCEELQNARQRCYELEIRVEMAEKFEEQALRRLDYAIAKSRKRPRPEDRNI